MTDLQEFRQDLWIVDGPNVRDIWCREDLLAIDNADNKSILGFYSLVPGALAHADVPETVRGSLARQDVPGFRLVRIATELRCEGQGIGGQLLAAAARRLRPAVS